MILLINFSTNFGVHIIRMQIEVLAELNIIYITDITDCILNN